LTAPARRHPRSTLLPYTTLFRSIANGDLGKKATVDVKGEILSLKNTINTMVDQLNAFAGEVTRVAREVGTEGRLGGQAFVKGVRSEEHTSELQSRENLVCRLLLE